MADELRRVFATPLPSTGGEVVLDDESAQHVRVLRLRAGERVQLFDGLGAAAPATLREVSRARVICDALATAFIPAPEAVLHVVVCIPKGKKLDDIARALTELGVSSIRLASSERSVPRPNDSALRLERLERITREACAQSGQPRTPELYAPTPLALAAAQAPPDARRFVFWEQGGAPLPRDFGGGQSREVWAVIGPEGGLSEAEVTALDGLGYASIGLGPAVLRVQTAAPVIAALLLERLGRLQR
ncbi:MAG: RsmE family RNA methyltransferase [Polyangiales bacterium]